LKKILITGRTGFFASSLSRYFKAVGNIETLFFSRKKVDKNTFVINDNNFINYKKNHRFQNIDAIVNMVGYVPVPENKFDFDSCIGINLEYLKKLLQFAEEIGVKKFIQVSSFAVYGRNPNGIINEETLPLPDTIYSQTKLFADYFLYLYASKFDLGITILRPAFTYGPLMNKKRMIPQFIKNLRKNRSLEIYHTKRKFALTYINDFLKVILKEINTKRKYYIINTINEIIEKGRMVSIIHNHINSNCNLKYIDEQTSEKPLSIDQVRYKNLIGCSTTSKFKENIKFLVSD
tara:strand:- start:422 stop:1294 length:873 start_codon:yes stop_codon:yes gene_type:complete